MQFQQTQDFEKILLQFTQIPEEIFSEIRIGNVALQIIESKYNLKRFLSVLQDLSNDFWLSDKVLENPICKQNKDVKVYISSSNHDWSFQLNNIEKLKTVILTEFKNVQYYAYQTQDYNLIQNNEEDEQIKMKWQQEYPQLALFKHNQSIRFYTFLIGLTEGYEKNDYSTPKISFHYNSDESQAILVNKDCQKEIVLKVVSQINEKDQLFFEWSGMYFLILKGNNYNTNINNNSNNHNKNDNNQNNNNPNKSKSKSKSFNKIDDDNNNKSIFYEAEQEFEMLLKEYPQLTKIKNQKELNYELLKIFTTVYETHDYSLPDISFHYNADGSQAILCSLFCQKEIIQKAIAQRDDFDFYFYDLQSMNFLLKKEKSMILEDFDEHLLSYDNNSIPLSTYLSIKFEESKKYLNNLGVYQKKNLRQIGTIPNLRLRQDLFELYECLHNDLEFNDLYQDQYCYAYYTQGDNPFLLEGLIVGPEDTPYKGVVYTLTIKVPQDYPNTPPDVYFNENILHPNISEKGRICLDILNNKWSPALTIQKVLISIVSLLYEKNLNDVYNHYAKCLYIENPVELKKQILKQAVFSGCKKVDINYNEVSKLSCQQKRKYIQESDGENEYDDENLEVEDNDYCEDE